MEEENNKTNNNNSEIAYIAVSYTHLDVYKRQQCNTWVNPSSQLIWITCFSFSLYPLFGDHSENSTEFNS